MNESDRDRLANAWTQAAPRYEQYFEPRFAPWVRTAVGGLSDHLVLGPVLVPCCGPFPELASLDAAHPGREIVGIDLSPGMIDRARRRAADVSRARAIVGDATDLAAHWPGTAAAVVSVFGLQQLPDPVGAIADWARALHQGGGLSVVYWPPVTETSGPFALAKEVTDDGSTGDTDGWPDQLADAIAATGARVLTDRLVSHRVDHPDAAALWDAMVNGGPLRSLAIARGEAAVAALREEFLRRAPSGPLAHRPSARWVLATR